MTTTPTAAGGTGPSSSTGAAAVVAALSRVRTGRAVAAPGERCDMCGREIPADDAVLPRTSGRREHAHVVDLRQRRLLCTCRPCAMLFPAEAPTAVPGSTGPAPALAYRAVPDRYLRLPTAGPSATAAGAVPDSPVGLAFTFVNSALGRPVACYPGPAGATESQLPLPDWEQLVATSPTLAGMVPDVEAVLVRRTTGADASAAYLVPIDACYALVGRLRASWRGFDGGREAQAVLDEFFAALEAVSR